MSDGDKTDYAFWMTSDELLSTDYTERYDLPEHSPGGGDTGIVGFVNALLGNAGDLGSALQEDEEEEG